MEDGDPGRELELNLGGKHLAAAAVGLVALCASFFLLGRWVERAAWQADLRADSFEEFPDPLEGEDPAPREVADGGQELTFFEDLEEKAPPPRQGPAPGEGGYTVQVFATRDQKAAERLAKQLKDKGFPGAVDSGEDGRGRLLYRVRVGPYPERGQAEQVASRLEKEERLSTWIRSP